MRELRARPFTRDEFSSDQTSIWANSEPSHCQQQQSYSALLSPGRSNSTYFWNDSWVQTFHCANSVLKRKVSQSTDDKPIYLVREKKCLTCFLNKALCQAWLLLFFRDDFKGSESQNTSFCKSRRLGNLSPSLLSFKIPEESELDWKKTHQRYKGA